MSPGVRSAILSALIFGAEVGVTAYMVGHMEIEGWSDRWLLQHPVTFGVGVGLLTLIIGLLFVIALNTSPESPAPGVSGAKRKPPATS